MTRFKIDIGVLRDWSGGKPTPEYDCIYFEPNFPDTTGRIRMTVGNEVVEVELSDLEEAVRRLR